LYIRNFEDLKVWQKSHELVKQVYKEVNLPSEERYGLESQLRRAIISVPANIAEGCRRQYDKELIQFLSIALGSLSEVRYYLVLCKDLGYITEITYKDLCNKCITIDKMLDSLVMKIRKSQT
jgi:four helix bundle protein